MDCMGMPIKSDQYVGVSLKWWYPTTMGNYCFPIKNDHFGVWNGETMGNPPFKETANVFTNKKKHAQTICGFSVKSWSSLRAPLQWWQEATRLWRPRVDRWWRTHPTELRMSRPVKEVDGSMVYGITGLSYNLLINGIYWLVVIGSLG